MAFFDLESDERDDDHIRWTAGGESDVAVYIGGERVARRTIQKGQHVSIHYADANGESDGGGR